jgi:uncharacterized phosphosugar-binding protein
MLQKRYLARVRELLDKIETTQAQTIDHAAEVVAEALATGHGFFISPLGHGNDTELLHRAGGLMALRPFRFSFSVESPVAACLRARPRPVELDPDLEAARLAVRTSELRRGDCLIVGSVSGRTPQPINLALAAREMGVTVIGITSLEYSSRVSSAHPSGRKLSEVVDIVIDNCVPYGDAALEVPGLPVPVLPLSGLATVTICWMLCAQVMEKLLARGLRPHVYLSVNRPEGPQFNAEEEKEYQQLGY